MKFELPQLAYELDALAPHISKQTLEFHYGKHHQAYVNNLNNLIPGTAFEDATLEEIVMNAENAIYNNAAQIWNHSFYFESFAPNAGGEPTGKIAELINRDFESFAAFKEQFNKTAATLFGSGWAWLSINNEGKLVISQEINAGNPMRSGLTPLMTCDVWEHAYYLDYQNKRPDYISSFWNLINWEKINERLA